MVLESLFDVKKIKTKPANMFIASFLTTIVSIFVAHIIFKEYCGLVLPFLITLSMSPIVYRIFQIEEFEDRLVAENKLKEDLIDRHGDVIYLFSLFFIGVFLATFVSVFFLPEQMTGVLFKQQIEDINAIKSVTGNFLSDPFLEIIIINNLKVMFFSFILSFLFGVGALIILSWNATIAAVYLSSLLRKSTPYFFATTIGILPHMLIEISAYFIAGIAGGILSVGMIREKFGTKEFKFVIKDSLLMLLISVLLVIVAGVVEVFL